MSSDGEEGEAKDGRTACAEDNVWSEDDEGDDVNGKGSVPEPDDFGLRRNVIFEGPINGFKVIASGNVNRASTVFKELNDRANISTAEGNGFESNDDGDRPVYHMYGRSFLFRRCRISFMSIEAVHEHHVMCKVPTSSRLLVDRAVRPAMHLISTDSIPIKTKSVDNPDFKAMEVSGSTRSRV